MAGGITIPPAPTQEDFENIPLFAQRATPVVSPPSTIFQDAWDWGFGSDIGTPGAIYGVLPVGARSAVEWWRNRSRRVVPPVVISEIPETVVPQGTGTVAPTGTGGALSVPKGFRRCIIQGVERLCSNTPPPIRSPVLEPFDPSVVIGEVQGPDTRQQDDEENVVMAHDWGHLARELIGGAIGISDPAAVAYSPGYASQFTGTTLSPGTAVATPGLAGCEPCGPRYLTYDCKTGKFSSRKRRRRRRLITPTDLGDLASIVAITGKGAGMNQAIAQAVRR